MFYIYFRYSLDAPPSNNAGIITKYQILHGTTDAKGMNFSFHVYNTPLENGDYESGLKTPPSTSNNAVVTTSKWNKQKCPLQPQIMCCSQPKIYEILHGPTEAKGMSLWFHVYKTP